jgi:hypothetical protein
MLHNFGRTLYEKHGRDEDEIIASRAEEAELKVQLNAEEQARRIHTPALERFFGFSYDRRCEENEPRIKTVCAAQFDSRQPEKPTTENPGEIPITNPHVSVYQNCLDAGKKVLFEARYCIDLDEDEPARRTH